MTQSYLRNTSADMISGMAAAYDGIRDSLVLMNGPLGCRFFHAYSSGQALPRTSELTNAQQKADENVFPDTLLRSQWYCGTARIPGTNLRWEDNIFGSREQLTGALKYMLAHQCVSLVAVLQSPGTSLLGEDLEPEIASAASDAGVPYFFEEDPRFSEDLWIGYDTAALHILEKLMPIPAQRKSSQDPKVNLLGMSVNQRYFEGDVRELERLLELCGIHISCVLCGNCTIEEIAHIPDAALNIIIHPEKCVRTVKWLTEKAEIPRYICSGPPIGFGATERMLREIGSLLQINVQPALADCEHGRGRAYYYLARATSGKGFPKDKRYSMEGTYSELCAYIDFLSEYLGLLPASLSPLCPKSTIFKPAFIKKAGQLGFGSALDREILDSTPSMVLGNANTIMAMRLQCTELFGIETAFQSMGYVDVLPKTHLGTKGALFLLEQILNGMKFLED